MVKTRRRRGSQAGESIQGGLPTRIRTSSAVTCYHLLERWNLPDMSKRVLNGRSEVLPEFCEIVHIPLGIEEDASGCYGEYVARVANILGL
jgi:hypothetical protein